MKTQKRSAVSVVGGLAVVLMTAMTSGCLDRELKPLNPCLVSGVTAKIAVTNVDKVDILFMVDNSNSMKEEQDALKREFPRLIQTLVTGMRSADDPNPFPPAKDLHLAVVSSDMGLVGINGITNCTGFGDDGLMRDPATEMCNGGVAGQRFLAYKAGSMPDLAAATTFANNFGCLADLGTGGCGFEQQLESTLKALWPKVDVDVDTQMVVENRITFLRNSMGQGAFGHGDQENKGFLRSNPSDGLSLLAVVLVTDEEDCSSADTGHFKPMSQLQPTDKNYNVDLNLRCFRNPDNLYKLDKRYLPGFKALRGKSAENLVIFAAIAGVPVSLVDEAARKDVDFSDQASRDAYYDTILADPRMQAVVDPMRMPGDGNLKTSCDTTTGKAYPPIRIVQLAKLMGENAVIQSICQESFAPAMDAIIEVIAKQLGAVCLPKPLVRKADGKVGCNVVWELPKAGPGAPASTPRECGGLRPYLLAPDKDRAATNELGGVNCKVLQLPADKGAKMVKPSDGSGGTEPAGLTQGWFYDDFTPELAKECSPETPHRIAFTADAKPPTGVTVKLECLNETQTVVSNRTDVDLGSIQPEIGTPCSGITDSGGNPIAPDTVCVVKLSNGMTDAKMFCHPQLNVCVKSCSSDSQCPPAWVCDQRGETLKETASANRPKGSSVCVNPTCGTN